MRITFHNRWENSDIYSTIPYSAETPPADAPFVNLVDHIHAIDTLPELARFAKYPQTRTLVKTLQLINGASSFWMTRAIDMTDSLDWSRWPGQRLEGFRNVFASNLAIFERSFLYDDTYHPSDLIEKVDEYLGRALLKRFRHIHPLTRIDILEAQLVLLANPQSGSSPAKRVSREVGPWIFGYGNSQIQAVNNWHEGILAFIQVFEPILENPAPTLRDWSLSPKTPNQR